MEMNSPMFSMAYDSANPDAGDNPMNAMLKNIFSAMIGESFTLVMAPTGEVQKVEGFAKLAEKMFKNIPQDPATAGMLDGLKANLSDDAMRNMFTQTFAQFPNRPLKSGDTWNSQFSHQPIPCWAAFITSVDLDAEGDGRRRAAIAWRRSRPA